MYKIIFIIILSLFTALSSHAREVGIACLPENDSLKNIILPDYVVSRDVRKINQYKREAKRHDRLVHHVRQALPYAKSAAAIIIEIETRLTLASSEKEKKRLIQEEYSNLMKTFKKPLMQLTVTQGKILVRLVYRETQKSSFHHIKEYKGGANAYFWQTLALLFGNNLKADYDPEGKDFEIESIVQDIEAGRL